MDTISLLEDIFGPLANRHLLDVGCGEGYLARVLTGRGAAVSGLDPDATALEKAQTVAPKAEFHAADASQMPFQTGFFSGAIFLNSLHHVPAAHMAAALREAARVTRAGDPIVVIEPAAHGSFFEAFRPIEDETSVRAEAQAAIDSVIRTGVLREVASHAFARVETFKSFDAYIARVAGRSPERQREIAARRGEIEERFESVAGRDETGQFVLEQPLIARILVGGLPAGGRS